MATTSTSHSVQDSYPTQHTEDGKPYIIIPSSSDVPIYLTELLETDIPAMIATLNIPEIAHALVSIAQPYTQAHADWWYNHQKTGKSNLPLQALRHSSPGPSGTFIGSVALLPAESEALKEGTRTGIVPLNGRVIPRKGECEVGYYLHPDWQGKGIMRNAVKGLIEWGKRDEGVDEIIITALETNKASRAVVEKMGGWKRIDGRETVVDWPENKGGGKKLLLAWRWEEDSSKIE